MKAALFNSALTAVIVMASSAAQANPSPVQLQEGGYNGPDLAGQSIPIALDRAISLPQIDKAYYACGAVLTKSLVQQITRRPCDNPLRRLPTNFDDRGFSWACDPKVEDQFSYISFEAKYATFTVHMADLPTYRNDMTLGLPKGVPFLKYETIAPDPSYDELGRLIPPAEDLFFARNLQLVLPGVYSSAVQLYNTQSEHVTAVTANLVQYANCLRARVQD